MKICFLLGSGVSIPADLPSVETITKRILFGDRIRCVDGNDNARYRLDENWQSPMNADEAAWTRQKLEPMLQLLRSLQRRTDAWLTQSYTRRANYEDLAYLAEQICDHVWGNRENPGIEPFVQDLADEIAQSSSLVGKDAVEKLGELADEVRNYIHDIVGAMLEKEPAQTGYLGIFEDAARDDRIGEVNLFTLNHDTLAETFLRTRAVELVDGFGGETDGIRRWEPSVFDSAQREAKHAMVRIFKLHGSIDWFRWGPRLKGEAAVVDQRDTWPDEFIGTQTSSKGKPPVGFERRQRSLFLAGTHNKEIEYTTGPFLELHYRFHRLLGDSDRLIVVGYGFGDKGVNQRIAEWMGASRSTRLLVIDPKPAEKIATDARPAISMRLDDWIAAGRFVHWPCGIDEICWSGLAGKLLLSPM